MCPASLMNRSFLFSLSLSLSLSFTCERENWCYGRAQIKCVFIADNMSVVPPPERERNEWIEQFRPFVFCVLFIRLILNRLDFPFGEEGSKRTTHTQKKGERTGHDGDDTNFVWYTCEEFFSLVSFLGSLVVFLEASDGLNSQAADGQHWLVLISFFHRKEEEEKEREREREREREKNLYRFQDKGSARTSKNSALVSGAVAGTAAERNRRTKDKWRERKKKRELVLVLYRRSCRSFSAWLGGVLFYVCVCVFCWKLFTLIELSLSLHQRDCTAVFI